MIRFDIFNVLMVLKRLHQLVCGTGWNSNQPHIQHFDPVMLASTLSAKNGMKGSFRHGYLRFDKQLHFLFRARGRLQREIQHKNDDCQTHKRSG